MATDQVGRAIAYANGKWGRPVNVDGGNIATGTPLGPISCASPTFCEAITSDGRMAKFDGKKWSLSPQPGYSGYNFSSVSCVSPAFCVAVGGPSGGFAVYADGGWQHPGTADPGATLTTVSCPTTRFCMTVNLNSDQTNLSGASSRTYNGKVWSNSIAMPPGFGNGQAVSCLRSHFCAAIDDGGDAAVYNGKSWAHGVTIDPGPLQTVDISCAAKSLCVVVDQHGHAVIYNGSKWGKPILIDGIGLAAGAAAILTGVSCASTSFCVAVGGDQAVTGR